MNPVSETAAEGSCQKPAEAVFIEKSFSTRPPALSRPAAGPSCLALSFPRVGTARRSPSRRSPSLQRGRGRVSGRERESADQDTGRAVSPAGTARHVGRLGARLRACGGLCRHLCASPRRIVRIPGHGAHAGPTAEAGEWPGMAGLGRGPPAGR